MVTAIGSDSVQEPRCKLAPSFLLSVTADCAGAAPAHAGKLLTSQLGPCPWCHPGSHSFPTLCIPTRWAGKMLVGKCHFPIPWSHPKHLHHGNCCGGVTLALGLGSRRHSPREQLASPGWPHSPLASTHATSPQPLPAIPGGFGLEGILQLISFHPRHGQGHCPLSQVAPSPSLAS